MINAPNIGISSLLYCRFIDFVWVTQNDNKRPEVLYHPPPLIRF